MQLLLCFHPDWLVFLHGTFRMQSLEPGGMALNIPDGKHVDLFLAVSLQNNLVPRPVGPSENPRDVS